MRQAARAGSSGRRAQRLLVVALALCLTALACAGDGAEPEEAAPGDAAETSAPQAADSPEPEATGTEDDQDAATETSSALQGETIDFVVPYDPGGGYDTYVRLVSPFLEDCTGATVVVRNEPGAGGLVATTQTFVTPPDTLRIQIVNSVGATSAQIAGAEGARFELQEFSWLGRISSEPNVLVVGASSEIQDFSDILAAEEPIRFVATGPGSNEYVNSSILPEVYGFPSEVITGFAGSGEARTAVIAGDADAHILPLDSQIGAIQAGEVRPVLVIGQEAQEAIPDVPTVGDFPPETPEQQAILDSLVALVETGRGVVAPPGMAEDTVEALREGLACALEDPELLQLAQDQQRPISALGGEETAALVDQVLNAPEAFRQLVTEAS